jgi:hypothetical protein
VAKINGDAGLLSLSVGGTVTITSDVELWPEDKIDDVVVDVVTGDMPQSALETWFKARISKVDV